MPYETINQLIIETYTPTPTTHTCPTGWYTYHNKEPKFSDTEWKTMIQKEGPQMSTLSECVKKCENDGYLLTQFIDNTEYDHFCQCYRPNTSYTTLPPSNMVPVENSTTCIKKDTTLSDYDCTLNAPHSCNRKSWGSQTLSDCKQKCCNTYDYLVAHTMKGSSQVPCPTNKGAFRCPTRSEWECGACTYSANKTTTISFYEDLSNTCLSVQQTNSTDTKMTLVFYDNAPALDFSKLSGVSALDLTFYGTDTVVITQPPSNITSLTISGTAQVTLPTDFTPPSDYCNISTTVSPCPNNNTQTKCGINCP